MNCEQVYRNIQRNFENYVVDAKLDSVVLGISGGIDSAIVAAIARPIVDHLGMKLIGLSLPSETNKIDEEARADSIGKEFCSIYKVKYIDNIFQAFVSFLENVPSIKELTEKELKISRGNIKARIRMITLYHTASWNKGMVLSTDNLTELKLGYWSLHGDVGDYGMIQNLWKTEVYELAKWIVENKLKTPEQKEALQRCIDATPTDGLGITNSDLDQIGASSYAEVDKILQDYVSEGITTYNGRNDVVDLHPVLRRHFMSQFKRNNPYNIPREELLK